MSPVLRSVQVCPASSVQRQFWLLQRLQPESRAYHVASVFRISGHLDVNALRNAFQKLVARHESLRTTFEERDGVLFQRVSLLGQMAVETSNELAVPNSAEIEAEITKPFELERGPLLRVRVWQTTSDEHVLAWTMHHVVVDLASKDILSRELGTLYATYLGGLEVDLEPRNHRYSDFCVAEAAWRRSEKAQNAEDYFYAHLVGEMPPLALPLDHPRPPLQSHRGARVVFELGDTLGSELDRIASKRQAPPFVILLSAFALTLGRYSAASRVVLGVPFTNRRRAESKDTVGCFVNTLPVSVDVSGNLTFHQVREQVRQVMLGHHRHQEISLDQILGRVRPTRDASRNPLYQAGFTFEYPMQLELAGARIENLRVHPGGSQLDLFLTMWQAEGKWHGHLEYCSELFDLATMQRFISNYLALLERALDSETAATKPVGRLDCLSAREQQQVIVDFNRTEHHFGRSELMHELFLEQAAKTPDAVAVRWSARQFTYRELQEYAQGLANELRAEGVRDGDRVGIYMPRSIEMVVSVLAVLLAGAAYVPIDPEFPLQRIEYVLEDAQPRCVLGHPSLSAQWKNSGTSLRHVELKQLSRATQAPHSRVTPSGAAYVIFTSGSTGRPKGVAVSHRAICNSMLWMQSAFQLQPDDVLVQTTPYSFDVSAWELLWVFIVGAQLAVPEEGVHRDPSALAKLIERACVTTIHFVPSMLQVFLEQVSLADCRSLRRVLCIGEALSGELVKRFHAASDAELHNLYGPTEAAVQASWWFCQSGAPTSPVPIGKPIANTKFYILDAQQCPVPIGVPGELYIGGVQVALEYVNRPDLTAKAFVIDPFATEPGARMYRTGDLARWGPDGNVEFLGRADFQVKIRGLRIELGEIESVLERHPFVGQCIVVARRVAGGMDAQLLAYVTATTPVDANFSDELRAHAIEQLPSYMVPNRFVVLDRFPLNSNGKADRKALPVDVFEQTQQHNAATNDMECWLSEQWSVLLEVKGVGITDNFFEVGGTSLMAARLLSRIRERFSVDVPLVRLFEYPTIAQLSACLGAIATTANPTDDALLKARAHAANRRIRSQRLVPKRSQS